jgi:hypothetical protein
MIGENEMDDENNIPSAIEAVLSGNISRFNDIVADTLRQKAEDAVSAKFDEVQYNMFAGEQEDDYEHEDTEYDDSEITDEEIEGLMSEYEEDDYNDEESE